jgi:hypothetical protein
VQKVYFSALGNDFTKYQCFSLISDAITFAIIKREFGLRRVEAYIYQVIFSKGMLKQSKIAIFTLNSLSLSKKYLFLVALFPLQGLL